jgi:putative hydrolase of the HAD superfamily
MLQAVTFDATGTLFHCPRLGEIYSEVLARHGVAVAPAEAARLVTLVWQELDCRAEPGSDRFSAHPEGPRGWWARFLARVYEHLGAPAPARFAAAELYHRFAQADSWELYPEVPRVLAALHGQGLKLAVVANWDPRLAPLVEALGLRRFLDAVVTSAEVGVEKPDRRIFATALVRLGVEAAAALHVGDRQLEDFEGAIAAGMRALRVDRRSMPRPARGRAGPPPPRDLSGLPGLVATLQPQAAQRR